MTTLSRRGVLAGMGAALAVAGCSNPVGSNGGQVIDARVDMMRNYLFAQFPGTEELESQAHGVLYMPLVTEGGFMFGGAYGRGALRINNITVDYYSVTSASFGLQIGAQQYAHALFFMTPEALQRFRTSDGWTASAGVRYATPEGGAAALLDSTAQQAPIVAMVFGQSGLIAGGALSGGRYTRIIP